MKMEEKATFAAYLSSGFLVLLGKGGNVKSQTSDVAG